MNIYMDKHQSMWNIDFSLACYTCGWRLYGEEKIRQYFSALEEAEKKKRRPAPKPPPLDPSDNNGEPVDGHSFRVGDLDPVLQVRWKAPSEEGSFAACAWPPCEKRSRKRSMYCSRKCCVKVAHKRESLRKRGALVESARVVK